MFRIVEFFPFLFLILIPFLIYINRHSLIQASSWRRLTTLLFRIVAIVCIILALTGLQLKKESSLLSMVFVLDLSDSVLSQEKEKAVAKINHIIEQLEENDKYGLVVFGADAYVKMPLTSAAKKATIGLDVLNAEGIDTTYTNLAKSLQLSLGMLSNPKYQGRIVMVTDGRQNSGDVRNLLKLARASEIGIFTIPLKSEREPELIVERLDAPDEVRLGSVFRLQGIIQSTNSMKAKLRLYRDDTMVESRDVSLTSNRQIVDFHQALETDGVYQYELRVEPSEDSISANNIAYQTVKVRKDKPRILLVQSKSKDGNRLKQLLEENLFDVTLFKGDKNQPSSIFNSSTKLSAYDCLILNNLHADEIGTDGMKMIENYVRDNGKGLVVIGGNQSLGMGNYLDTPLERSLPVEMTPRQKKGVMALTLLIDKSGSMANWSAGVQKIQLAKAAAKSAIKTLNEKDLVGVLAFDAKTREVFGLTQAKEKDDLIRKVGTIRAGSGTKMYPALKKAYRQLAEVDAKHKLVLILSDGKSKGDFIPLAEKMADDKISIYAIAIGDAARKLMKSIAEAGKGRYFYVPDVSQLPKIVTKEIHQTQDLIVEKEFRPKIVMQHSILEGLKNLPKLYGYVGTAKKQAAFSLINSDKDEPILAAWNYGLGRSVAFTSNIETNWAAEWIEWKKYGKFWTQIVNWALPDSNKDTSFDLFVSNDSGTARVILERSNIGNGSQTPKFKGRVLKPDGEGIQLRFRRISFNRYESTFNANRPGTYLVTVKSSGRKSRVCDTKLIVPYSPEYSKLEVNTPLLRELADISKGEFRPKIQTVTRRPEKAIKRYVDLWKWMILAAVSLFVAELIARRLTLTGRLKKFTEKTAKTQKAERYGLFRRFRLSPSGGEVSSEESELPLATRLLEAKRRDGK